MKLFSPFFAVTLMLALAPSAHADEAPATVVAKERTNSVNASPLGILTGAYGVNYEKLLGSHGLLIEGSFNRSTGDDASAMGGGLNVGYRWHWRGRQSSGFLGLTVGYHLGTAEATVDNGTGPKTFDLDTKVFAVTGNIGKRWAWNNGLNVTFRVGAGYGNYNITTDSTDPDAQDAVAIVDGLLTLFPVAFDGELSVGYAF